MGTFSKDTYVSGSQAALVGGTAPPFNVSIRPLWRDIVGDERVRVGRAGDDQFGGRVVQERGCGHERVAIELSAASARELVARIQAALDSGEAVHLGSTETDPLHTMATA